MSTFSSRRARRLFAEQLENRLLLTASAASTDALDHVDPLEQEIAGESVEQTDVGVASHRDTPPGLELNFQLRIVGTGVAFDPVTQLPSNLDGDVYYVGGSQDGEYAGRYEESFTPVIHPEYGMVGAVGTGVFTFQNQSGKTTFGEITVEYHAYIVGMDPSGAILVQSEGEVVGGTRSLRDAEGGYTTASSVLLGPAFAMNVEVNMQAQRTPGSDGDSLGLLADATDTSARPAPHTGNGNAARSLADDDLSAGGVADDVEVDSWASSLPVAAQANSRSQTATDRLDQVFARWSHSASLSSDPLLADSLV